MPFEPPLKVYVQPPTYARQLLASLWPCALCALGAGGRHVRYIPMLKLSDFRRVLVRFNVKTASAVTTRSNKLFVPNFQRCVKYTRYPSLNGLSPVQHCSFS